jgi:hypothetical protein
LAIRSGTGGPRAALSCACCAETAYFTTVTGSSFLPVGPTWICVSN